MILILASGLSVCDVVQQYDFHPIHILKHTIYIYIYIYTNPSARAGCDTRSIFKRTLNPGLNPEFSFSSAGCHTNAKKPSLPYYLPIAGWRTVRKIPFQRVLMWWEMQTAWFRIWTWIIMSKYIYMNEARPKILYIFTNPSSRAGYDTSSIFKRSLTGLNSEFSFS